METSQLQLMQQPRRAQSLLESISWREDLLPPEAWRITWINLLPFRLKLLADESQRPESAWVAWTDGQHIWFFTASASLTKSRERKKPVLDIRLHDERGVLLEVTNWVLTDDAGWQQCD